MKAFRQVLYLYIEKTIMKKYLRKILLMVKAVLSYQVCVQVDT